MVDTRPDFGHDVGGVEGSVTDESIYSTIRKNVVSEIQTKDREHWISLD